MQTGFHSHHTEAAERVLSYGTSFDQLAKMTDSWGFCFVHC